MDGVEIWRPNAEDHVGAQLWLMFLLDTPRPLKLDVHSSVIIHNYADVALTVKLVHLNSIHLFNALVHN